MSYRACSFNIQLLMYYFYLFDLFQVPEYIICMIAQLRIQSNDYADARPVYDANNLKSFKSSGDSKLCYPNVARDL